MKNGDILIHKISNTLSEVEMDELGISLKFQLSLGNRIVSSATRYYSEEEVLKSWRIANENEKLLYKLNIK